MLIFLSVGKIYFEIKTWCEVILQMKKFGPEIGNRLKEARKSANISSSDISNKTYISLEHYHMIEYGQYYPNKAIIDYAHSMNWDIDYIILGLESNNSIFDKYLDYNNMQNRLYRYQQIHVEIHHILGNTPNEITFFRWKPESEKPLDRLKFTLANNGVNANDETLSEILGVSKRTVSRINNGHCSIGVNMLISAYEHCEITPSYFLYGEINSHSECDRLYKLMSTEQQRLILKYAKKICSI